MLNVVSYATISNDVYYKSGTIRQALTYKSVKKGHSGLLRMLDVDSTMNINNPFYAQLYLNFRNGEAVDAVIGYRGTAKVGNSDFSGYTDFEVDIKSWYKSVLDGNQSIDSLPSNNFTVLAAQFYRTSRDYLSEYFPKIRLNRLHVTGHSLGGALAALMPTICMFPARAITFNAPGIGTITGVDTAVANHIFGVEARYDFVSKIGIHVEKQIHMVDVPNMENVAKQAFVLNGEANALEQEIRTDPGSFKTPFRVEQVERDKEVAGYDTFRSALAQHKMINLLDALKEPKYSALANKLIV